MAMLLRIRRFRRALLRWWFFFNGKLFLPIHFGIWCILGKLHMVLIVGVGISLISAD
jgi:hypothetical protein